MKTVVRPEPGTRLAFRWRKWDGSPHWVHECAYLGADRWGDWFGQDAGWLSARPGRTSPAPSRNVTLLPPSGDHTLTVNVAPPALYRVYIDLAWDARWGDDGGPEGVDMDLDVVRTVDGRGLWIDDRDEWEEHRVLFGYPSAIVEALESLALELEGKVADGTPPYDDATAEVWLRRLDALAADGKVAPSMPA